jgi:hypothetical protein
LTPRNDLTDKPKYRAVMFEFLRKSDDNPASSLGPLIISMVVMAILFGFGLATFIFRLQTHTHADAVIPAVVLSLAGLCLQFGTVRFLIRHLTQVSEQQR